MALPARTLLAGMSGVGKPSVGGELRRRGFPVIDMDEPGWSVRGPAGEQLWRADRLRQALDTRPAECLCVSGCAENQVEFYPDYTHIILLSAPVDVICQRLAERSNKPYGKWPEQFTETLFHLQTVERRLRLRASHENRTTIPLDEVVAIVLKIARAGDALSFRTVSESDCVIAKSNASATRGRNDK